MTTTTQKLDDVAPLTNREFMEELDGRVMEVCLDHDHNCGDCPLATLTPSACENCCMGEVDMSSPVSFSCSGEHLKLAMKLIYERDVPCRIQHKPGRCCPDYDCIHPTTWDGKHCRDCGADCTECSMYEDMIRAMGDFKKDHPELFLET